MAVVDLLLFAILDDGHKNKIKVGADRWKQRSGIIRVNSGHKNKHGSARKHVSLISLAGWTSLLLGWLVGWACTVIVKQGMNRVLTWHLLCLPFHCPHCFVFLALFTDRSVSVSFFLVLCALPPRKCTPILPM